jgi:hypothetical protein
VIVICNAARVCVVQDPFNALLHRLKRLPVATRSKRIAVILIGFVLIGVPGAGANTFNQLGVSLMYVSSYLDLASNRVRNVQDIVL